MFTPPLTNASVPLDKLTPMLRQNVERKAERPDVVRLMRVGDVEIDIILDNNASTHSEDKCH